MAAPDNSNTKINDGLSRISCDAVAKAADALLRWLRARDSKPQLLEHDDFLYLQLSLHRFPSPLSKSSRVNPHLLPIPHPLFSDHPTSSASPVSICLFFDDRSPSASASALLDRSRALSLPVETAIGLSSLRSDYRPYEARRRLCDSHDIFFADRRVVPLLPRLIGKHFFRKKKAPLPVDLSRPGWPLQLRRCLNSALFHPPSKGTCTAVKVGRASMTPEEIADNAMAVVEGAVEYVPKGWANVRSVVIKAADSVALPVYQNVPQMGLKIKVATEVRKGEDLKHDDESEEGEAVDATTDEVGDEQFSGPKKKKQRKQKGRIHEVIMRYMEMDDKGEDAVDNDLDNNDDDVHEDENGEEGIDEEVEKSRTMKKRKKKEVKTKRKSDEDDFEREESDGLSAARDLNKKMKRTKGKANKKLKEENDGEQEFILPNEEAADRTEKKTKEMKKLEEKVKKIKKKSKVRQT